MELERIFREYSFLELEIEFWVGDDLTVAAVYLEF